MACCRSQPVNLTNACYQCGYAARSQYGASRPQAFYKCVKCRTRLGGMAASNDCRGCMMADDVPSCMACQRELNYTGVSATPCWQCSTVPEPYRARCTACIKDMVSAGATASEQLDGCKSCLKAGPDFINYRSEAAYGRCTSCRKAWANRPEFPNQCYNF